jgi:glycosyltransferase involved in cell wall biosynthesis
MRVVILLSSLYTGGAEFSTLSFYGWLRKKGFDVKLVCCKKASPTYNARDFDLDDAVCLRSGSFWGRVRDFNRIVREFKPDIVHSVLFEANIVGRFSRISQGEFVHVESLVNEMYAEHRLADPNITRLKLTGYRLFDFLTQAFGVDHFHANGQSVSLHYQHKLGIDPRRITVIPRGRKKNQFLGNVASRQKLRDEFHVDQQLLMICVARHEYQKGQDVLLDAVQALSPAMSKWKLLIVGREGRLTNIIREKIKNFKLHENVILTGHRTDVPALLAASDVFVFPSRFEGLPGALIEAEASALPIVASDIANNREVADEARNALFFPVGDSVSLSHCIAKMIDSAALRKGLGVESLAIFDQRFDLEEIHNRMLQMLLDLIPSK